VHIVGELDEGLLKGGRVAIHGCLGGFRPLTLVRVHSTVDIHTLTLDTYILLGVRRKRLLTSVESRNIAFAADVDALPVVVQQALEKCILHIESHTLVLSFVFNVLDQDFALVACSIDKAWVVFRGHNHWVLHDLASQAAATALFCYEFQRHQGRRGRCRLIYSN